MIVPDEVRKCVAYVGYQTSDGQFHLGGTVFFVARQIEGTDRNFQYAITARHVIEAITALGINRIYLRMNFSDGVARWVETNATQWRFHPADKSVDVAVARILLTQEYDHLVYPLLSAATEGVIQEQGIGAGDEVFVTGLFANHYGRQRNVPIVRVGNIAAMPEEPIDTKYGHIEAYLVEARSIGGLSGSPVFVNLGVARYIDGGVKFSNSTAVYFLLGLMHGHYGTRLPDFDSNNPDVSDVERVNVGIAIVVPITKILEVINQPMMREEERQTEEELRRKYLPTPDALPSSEQEQAGITRDQFFEALGKAARPIQPQRDQENSET
ncbi:MAG: hypothetical protein M3R24_42100 [Chloroflexota bacterium]|nr:hypothetical protein [Chloroflexota bacterium]